MRSERNAIQDLVFTTIKQNNQAQGPERLGQTERECLPLGR